MQQKPYGDIKRTTIERLLNTAKAVAMTAEGVGKNKNFRLGALLFNRKGKIYAARTNSYKTHPSLLRYSIYPCLHAESACILSAGMDYCHGLCLMVVRLHRNGLLSMAKPCSACSSLMGNVGVNTVYYTNWKGELECLEL